MAIGPACWDAHSIREGLYGSLFFRDSRRLGEKSQILNRTPRVASERQGGHPSESVRNMEGLMSNQDFVQPEAFSIISSSFRGRKACRIWSSWKSEPAIVS